MKKITILFALLSLAAGLFAQNREPRIAPENRRGFEEVTVSGNLALENGRIALRSGEELYYVAGLGQLIGFVDGLKEGARVSLEGYVRNLRGSETARFLLASKLTIGGKSYDLTPPERAAYSGGDRPGRDRQGYDGPRDRGHCGPGGRRDDYRGHGRPGIYRRGR